MLREEREDDASSQLDWEWRDNRHPIRANVAIRPEADVPR